MKNIHILQTDQPTTIFETNIGLQFSIINKVRHGEFKGYHIYITSDEDINENDYIIIKDGRLVQVSYLLSKDLEGASKVVLTTDQDLIKDGVQAIDDEFLEWFVKNPSYESVEVEKDQYIDKTISDTEVFTDYIIIIPKEEPKQVICRDKFDRVIQNGYYVDVQDSRIHKVYRKEDGQLYFKPYGEEERVSSYFSNDLILMSDGSKLIMDLKKEIADKKQEEPKQESLEEAAKKYANKKGDIPTTELEDAIFKQGFIDGANWQQERMYSEEEVKFIISEALQSALVKVDLEQWFNQFHKKK
jgi:hypothetical protein